MHGNPSITKILPYLCEIENLGAKIKRNIALFQGLNTADKIFAESRVDKVMDAARKTF